MQFTKIIGRCDPKIIADAEEKLSAIFIELATGYTNKMFGTKIGGDIMIHQLIYPMPMICDCRAIEYEEEVKRIAKDFKDSPDKEVILQALEQKYGKNLLTTAATDGKAFYFNPAFLSKLSKIGVRLVLAHEAWHALYMHPKRRGSRNPGLYNIAIDMKVNWTLMDDLKIRGFYNAEEIFRKELGDYVNLMDYAAFLKDPYSPPKALEGWNPIHSLRKMVNPGYQPPGEDKPLYYADPNLPEHLRKPENIYDFLWNQMPKCSCCGRHPAYKKPKEAEELTKQIKAIKKKADEQKET